MSGLAVKGDLAAAVRDAQRAFEEFGVDRFPRAVQFALVGVAIDAVNRFRGEWDWDCPGSVVLARFAWIRRPEPYGASGDRGLPVRNTGA
jgi:hypothetical protein